MILFSHLLLLKSKELQVLFGHVKAVFVSNQKDNSNIWLQASSGMLVVALVNIIFPTAYTFIT